MSLTPEQAIIDYQSWNILTVADHFVLWLGDELPDIGNACRRGIMCYRDNGELFVCPETMMLETMRYA
jgi:ADP-ribosyl-[dinitrogen reductase] hydrolase